MLTVSQAADWARINDAVLGFEDAIIREVWLDSGRWLTSDDFVIERGLSTVVVLVQFQSSPIRAAQLRFEGVSVLSVDESKDVYPAEAEDLKGGWEVRFLSCRIVATACEADLLGDDWVGRGPFLSGN